MNYPNFKPPPWLGTTPHGDFGNYGVGTEVKAAWFDDIPWEQRRSQCLYDAHVAALKGSPHNLELMRQFYINLVTRRLKQK